MWTFGGVIGSNLAFPFHLIAIVKGFCKVGAPALAVAGGASKAIPRWAAVSGVADQGGGPVLEGRGDCRDAAGQAGGQDEAGGSNARSTRSITRLARLPQ
jgi:hypothetical protein